MQAKDPAGRLALDADSDSSDEAEGSRGTTNITVPPKANAPWVVRAFLPRVDLSFTLALFLGRSEDVICTFFSIHFDLFALSQEKLRKISCSETKWLLKVVGKEGSVHIDVRVLSVLLCHGVHVHGIFPMGLIVTSMLRIVATRTRLKTESYE